MPLEFGVIRTRTVDGSNPPPAEDYRPSKRRGARSGALAGRTAEMTPFTSECIRMREAARRPLAARASYCDKFSNLDRPFWTMARCRLAAPRVGFGQSSWLTARRFVPAVRPLAGPAFVFEHPAMMTRRLPSCGSSYRSEDADRYLLNRCQSFDWCCPASAPNRRPGRTSQRYYRDQRARLLYSKPLRRSRRERAVL
jgi:hypothetical protein